MSLKSFEKTGTNEVTMELAIDAEAFNKGIQTAYNRQKSGIEIPGFRKGKAPLAFVEKYYGENVFYDDALEYSFPDVYEAAVEEAGLEVVDNPFDFDIKSIGKGGVELTLKVTVKPEVTIENYKGLSAEKEEVAVSDEEVETSLAKQVEENARLVSIDERAVKDGDIVTIDFEGSVNGIPFEGGQADGYELTIGSGQFIPGFEEQIIGHCIDDEFDVNVKFPEEYTEDLAGKDAVFKIKLHEIKEKQLPEVDDEFVKDISEFDTLDEYKADLKKQILDEKQAESDRAYKTRILDQVTELAQVEIPACMIEKAIDNDIDEFSYRLSMQGMDMDTYFKYTGLTMENMRNSLREKATQDTKLMLALEKIAELEGIEISDEEINAEYQKFADAYGMNIDDVKKSISEDTIKSDIANGKAIDLILEAATIKPAEENEEPAEEATEL